MFTAPKLEQRGYIFRVSSLMFAIGLAFETFEDVRPYGVLLADYFFLLSFLLLICTPHRRLLGSKGSGVLIAAALILGGVMVSFVSVSSLSAATAPVARVVVLFGLFAPLALVYSGNLRLNMKFLVAGVSVNCILAMIAAWVSPEFVDALAIDPQVSTDFGQEIGRFAGLAGHPNILGLSSALAVLVAIGLLRSENGGIARFGLMAQVLVCTIGGLLTGSRTFFVALVPALLVLTLWRRLNRQFFHRVGVAFAIVLVALIAVNYFAPDLVEQYTDRFSATSADDSVNEGRLLTASLALLEISQKPIVGWGVDRFGEAGLMYLPQDNDFMPAHVSFLQYWYAAGVVGAVGFLVLFFLPVRRILMALRDDPLPDLATALRLGVSVYLLLFIASNLHPILFNRFLYMPLFVFAGLVAKAPDLNDVRKLTLGKVARLTGPDLETTS